MKLCRLSVIALCLLLSACFAPERETGWAVGYGRSYAAPLSVTMPENAYAITQQFRRAELYSGGSEVTDHFGIDVHAPLGTPVLAAASGRVIASHWEPGYGHRIEVDHGIDGKGHSAQTNYVHLQKRLVRVGDQIKQGQQIATLGATGLTAGGFPHLHFEVLYKGTKLRTHAADPNLFWAKGIGRVTCFAKRHVWRPAQAFKITYPVACVNE